MSGGGLLNRPRPGGGSHVIEEDEKVDDEFSDIHNEFDNICYKLIFLSLHIPLLCIHVSSEPSRVLPLSFFFAPDYSPLYSTAFSSVNSSISFSL